MRQYIPKNLTAGADGITASQAKYGKSYRLASDIQKAARTQDRVVGRGLFGLGRARRGLNRLGLTNNMIRSGLVTGGTALGAQYGMGAAGGMAGSALSRAMGSGQYMGVSGRGAYAPIQNSSGVIHAGSRFQEPVFGASGDSHDDGGLIITNQEFISNVYATPPGVQYQSTPYDINPGVASTFPMLSQFAINFDKYEMIQCVFHYETQLDAGVIQSETGQVGQVLMYSHTDVEEPDFQNPNDFESNGGQSAPVTHGSMAGVECDPTQLAGLPNAGINYIRNTAVADRKEYDQAKFQIAVEGTPTAMDNGIIGKLYVSYTVRLIKPKLMSLYSRNTLEDVFIAWAEPIRHLQTDKLLVGGLRKSWPEIPNDVKSSVWLAQSPNNIGCKVANTIAAAFYDSATMTATGETPESTMKITFPAWTQGLVCVELQTITNHNDNTGPDADLVVDINDVGYIKYDGAMIRYVTQTGNIEFVNFEPDRIFNPDASTPFLATTDSYVNPKNPTESGMNNIFMRSEGDENIYSKFKCFIRLTAPPAGEENTLTMVANSNFARQWPFGNNNKTAGGMESRLSIRLVNDFQSVGTTPIDETVTWATQPRGNLIDYQ
jgi:hypothetical protein